MLVGSLIQEQPYEGKKSFCGGAVGSTDDIDITDDTSDVPEGDGNIRTGRNAVRGAEER